MNNEFHMDDMSKKLGDMLGEETTRGLLTSLRQSSKAELMELKESLDLFMQYARRDNGDMQLTS